jgi:anti-anti-sigma factor
MQINVYELPHVMTDAVDYNFIIFVGSAIDVLDAGATETFWTICRTAIKGGIRKMIIDMKDLEFIDSIGLAAVINTAKLIRAEKGDVVIINVPGRIENIMRPININRFITILKNEEDAFKYFKHV